MITADELKLLRNMDGGAILPGIDTQVGNPLSSSQLTNVTALSQSGVLYDPAHTRVLVTKDGTVLNGVNFGSLTVEIRANNVTIQDCTFAAPTGYKSVQVDAGFYGTTVTQDTFDSGLLPGPAAAWVASVGQITVTGNMFIGTPGDAVDLCSGTVSGNFFSGVGYSSSGTHGDAVWVSDSQGPVTISNNFIDWTANGPQSLVNNAVRITAETGSASNVTVNGNFLVGGSYTVDAGNAGSKGTFSNISITNNYLGFGAFGAFYPGAQSGVTASGNVIFDYTNPIYSTHAWAAYQAAGIQTTNLLISTGANIGSPSSTGSVTLYGDGFQQLHMYGGRGENIFVGGSSVQNMVGGTGANIFTYLSPGDSTVLAADTVASFDSAKDVIDLSHIDANLAVAGVQSFKFIGTASFSDGVPEVRYVQDPAHNFTYVVADRHGDGTPDLYIRVAGLQTLTAANFALTAAQSNAAIAAGVSGSALAPTISGTTSGQTTTSEAPVHPFANVTVADPNASATETLTITVGGAGGTLTGTGLTGGSGGVYTLSGTATAITGALNALSFTPTAGAPNTISKSTFTLSDVSSAYGAPTVDSATSVTDIDPAVAPTISGTASGQTTTSEAPVHPFASVTVADPNASATETLTITVGGAGGTLTGTGLTGGSGGVYTLSGTATAITGALNALSFTPTAGAPNTVSTSTFTLSDASSAYGAPTVDSATSITDIDPAVAPTISGTTSGQTTTSEAPVHPFANVTVADPNASATETLTITVGGAGGTLTGTGLTGGSGGVYTLSGTATAITGALNALSFTPTAGAPNTVSTSTFTLSDASSAYGAPTVDSATSITDIDPAVAPTISGTTSGQTTTSEAPVHPFANVTVADPNASATETLTITVGGAGGTLTGTGLTGGSGGVYTLSGTATAITGALNALSFTPTAGAPNTVSTSTFTLSDASSAYGAPTVDSATSITDIDPAIDPAVAPTISGTTSGQTTTSEAPVHPFANVTVADPNASATETLTITVGGAGGTLTGTGLTGGSGGVYTLSGTATAITGALNALSFTPTAGAPNTVSTSTFTLSDVSSAYGAPTVDTATSVTDIDPAVAPTITSGQTTTSEAPVHPFANVTVADPNASATETLTITVGGAGGTLTGTGLTGGSGGVYTLSGTATAITGALNALSFTPTAGAPNTVSTSTFTLSDVSSAYGAPTVDTATSVTDIDPAVAPTISGTTSGQTTTSEAPVHPFASVTVADPNASATETLTITVGGAGGTLTGTGLTGGSGGVYTLSGTATAITGALNALSFTPTAGAPNTVSTSTFTLSDASSAYGAPTVDSATSITDIDPAVAPTISGTASGQTTTSEAPVHPFANVTVADPNASATETLTITVGGAGGTLTGTGLTGGSGGVYTLSGTATAITGALNALSFTPTAGAPNTVSTSTFTLSDVSSAYGAPTVDSATSITDIDPAVGTASDQAWAAYLAAGIPTSNLIISTGANIGSSSSTGSVTLYGGGYSVVMIGGHGENNFVGGAGAQTMLGGVGANIFTYLSPSDSTVNTRDMVGYFDSAKDVIDLSHIDASLAAAGVQNFTFIGTAPFSGGGAQVRYVQDPAHNITYVEADLAGNSTPDLFIRVAGLQTLTAANFALTAAQSNADMANGAALSVSLKARVGNVFDYFYQNVAGEPYSSYDAIVHERFPSRQSLSQLDVERSGAQGQQPDDHTWLRGGKHHGRDKRSFARLPCE